MPLRLRLKQGDRLIVGEAVVEVDRIGLTSIHLIVQAPQNVKLARVRNKARQRCGRFGKTKTAPTPPSNGGTPAP